MDRVALTVGWAEVQSLAENLEQFYVQSCLAWFALGILVATLFFFGWLRMLERRDRLDWQDGRFQDTHTAVAELEREGAIRV